MFIIISGTVGGIIFLAYFEEVNEQPDNNNTIMIIIRYIQILILSFLSFTLFPGCDFNRQDNGTNSPLQAHAVPHRHTPQNKIILGDMLVDFIPPSLEDIERQVIDEGNWQERPVRETRQNLACFLNQYKTTRSVYDNSSDPVPNFYGSLPHTDDEVDYNGVLHFYSSYDVKSINPLLMNLKMETTLQRWIGVRLFDYDYTTYERFACAEYVKSWSTSPDGLYDKIVLRDDITWSDGNSITAYDYEFTFKLIMTKGIPIRICNEGIREMRWVKAYDAYTLVCFHRQKLATNDLNIDIQMIPKHIYESSVLEDPTLQLSEYHRKYEENPIVGGPYKILRHKRERYIVLEARDDYYLFKGKQVRSRPYCKHIHYMITPAREIAVMALKKGSLDFLAPTQEQWSEIIRDVDVRTQYNFVNSPGWGYGYIAWNLNSPFFSNPKVRQAMSYAFDYKEMFHTVLYNTGTANQGLFMANHPAFPPDAAPAYEQNLDKARSLLEEAGWKDLNNDGVCERIIAGESRDFEFTLYVSSSNTVGIHICELLKESLKKVSVRCNIRKIEYSALVQKSLQRQFQAMFLNGTNFTDPSLEESYWKSNAANNITGYSNKKVDELFEQGEKEMDYEKRMEIYGEIHKLIFEEQPYSFLFRMDSGYVCSKRIRGYGFTPTRILFEGMWIPKYK